MNPFKKESDHLTESVKCLLSQNFSSHRFNNLIRELTLSQLSSTLPSNINTGLNLLHVAATQRNSVAVYLLLCKGVPVDSADMFGRTIKDIAIANSDRKLLDTIEDYQRTPSDLEYAKILADLVKYQRLHDEVVSSKRDVESQLFLTKRQREDTETENVSLKRVKRDLSTQANKLEKENSSLTTEVNYLIDREKSLLDEVDKWKTRYNGLKDSHFKK